MTEGLFRRADAATEAESLRRREEITGRLVAWWKKMTEGQALHITTSYRRGLAAMELTAQIERYASAHTKIPRPPDEELVGACTRAATAYLNTFKPLPEGTPDADFGDYMEACELGGIDVGTPLSEFSPEILALLAAPKLVEEPPF